MALTAKQRKELLEKGRSVNLSPNDPKFQKPQRHDPHKIFSKVVPQKDPLPSDGRPSAVTTGRPVVPPADRRPLSPADRRPVAEEKKSESLPADRRTVVTPAPSQDIPLAPIQWRVWEAISQAEEEGRIISRRELASMAKATIRGVRDAMRVLEEAGGILSKQTIRTAAEQGIQFTLDHSISFRQASLKEALGIPKRSSSHRPTVGRRTVELPSDRRSSMYVCKKNTYIQEEDIKDLLGVCPTEWKIREATLTTIADYYPDMDPTTFRLSLLRAVEQAREGKAKIKHPNAWLKAAFEQNGAPLITARDIEAQVTRGQGAESEPRAPSKATPSIPTAQPEESEILRLYLAAPEEQRQEIDRRAEGQLEKMRPMLDQIGSEKHQEILVHARIEAARTVLTIPVSAPGDEG